MTSDAGASQDPEPAPVYRFDQARYWIDRHRELVGDPRAVGNLSLTLERNLAEERQIIRSVGLLTDMLDIPKSVLDLGCGYGRLAGVFLERGYDYLGVDVSPTALQQAKRRHPFGQFEVADLRRWTTERTFGVVSAIYLMAHFVDDLEWKAMVERALGWIALEGILLVADNFTERRVRPSAHVVLRPRSSYTRILEPYGFAFDEEFHERFVARNHGGASFWIARRIG